MGPQYAGKVTDVRVLELLRGLIDNAARHGHGGYPDKSLLKIVDAIDNWLEVKPVEVMYSTLRTPEGYLVVFTTDEDSSQWEVWDHPPMGRGQAKALALRLQKGE